MCYSILPLWLKSAREAQLIETVSARILRVPRGTKAPNEVETLWWGRGVGEKSVNLEGFPNKFV